MLKEELKITCIYKNIEWPILFKRFTDDGFGIIYVPKYFTKGREFNNLRENINIDKWSFGNDVADMNLSIIKCNKFYENGKSSIKVNQNPENHLLP